MNIGDYLGSVQTVLAVGGLYFALLVLSVLAIRFWRRLPKLSGQARWVNLILASLVTLLAAGTGYFSVCDSMSRMYWHFGMEAFHASRADSALLLFDAACKYRKTADALGGEGVCMLVTGRGEVGLSLLAAAKSMRHGKGTAFENYYEGLYYFFANDLTNAIPPMESASTDLAYAWEVTKLFAVVQLDLGKPQEAGRLMQPYLQAQITESEQAYVMARLALADGKIAEAKAIADKFLSVEMAAYWRKRFEQLETDLQNRKI